MRVDLTQLNFIDFTLRELVHSVERDLGVEFIITSIYRDGDTGVHGQMPVRGIDVRCKHDPLGHVIEAYTNSVWMYDADRPNKQCCIYHDVGQGKHLHFQVHPNTTRRGGYL